MRRSASEIIRNLERRVMGSARQLFHATKPPIVPTIIRNGLIPSPSYQEGGFVQSGISTAEDFSALSKGDFGNAIFILDRSEIERNFETGDVDYWGDNREKEVRVYTDKIHPRYLKGLIFIWKPKPFEIDWMLENYDLPLYHVNKRGGLERLTEFDGKKAKRERRVASEVIRNLETRIARLEKQSAMIVDEEKYRKAIREIESDFL